MTKHDIDQLIKEIGDRPLREDAERELWHPLALDRHSLPQEYPGRTVDVSRAKANVIKESTDALDTLKSFVGV